MLERDVGLARLNSKYAADVPAASEVWVERQRAVDQRQHRTDVLPKIAQRVGGIRQDDRVVAGYFEGSPCEIGTFQTVRFPVLAPTVEKQPMTEERTPGEGWPVTRIACDRLF